MYNVRYKLSYKIIFIYRDGSRYSKVIRRMVEKNRYKIINNNW